MIQRFQLHRAAFANPVQSLFGFEKTGQVPFGAAAWYTVRKKATKQRRVVVARSKGEAGGGPFCFGPVLLGLDADGGRGDHCSMEQMSSSLAVAVKSAVGYSERNLTCGTCAHKTFYTDQAGHDQDACNVAPTLGVFDVSVRATCRLHSGRA